MFRRSTFTATVAAGVALASALTPAMMASAQEADVDATVTAPATAAPPAPPAPPRVYPSLSPAQAEQLRKMLADSDSHGIELSGAVLDAPLGDTRTLIDYALGYARKLRSGQLAKEDYRKDWALRGTPYDPWPDFAAAVRQDRLAPWIASLAPPYTGYHGLRKGLVEYRAIEARGGWPTIPAGGELGIGADGPRVAALRKRLAAEDKGVALTGGYDAALAKAVQRAQKRFGLNPVGTMGAQTLAALNVPVSDRIGQIIANMERWRWLPRELATRRVQVNIAAAVLTMFEADAPVTSMRAVTGKPGDETPMLQSMMHSVVLNPPWNVPAGIAKRELFPKGAGYLARNGYRVIETPGGGKRLQQKPGPTSALGRFKFDFDNPYTVYLHDTPSQSTFDRFARLASHGCVRLQRPADLAKLLFKGDAEWTPEKIDATVASGKTVRAKLPEQVAVYLLYWTAFANSSGPMSLRDDPYGWDKLLAQKIAAKASSSAKLAAN